MADSTRAPLRVGPLSICPVWWGAAARLATLMCLLTLSACSGPARVVPAVPALHLPHVQEIPGSDSIHVGGDHGKIDGVADYQSPVRGNRVLMRIDGFIYDIGLDGSNPHGVESTCSGAPTATMTGHLWACDGAQSILLESLDDPTRRDTIEAGSSPALASNGSLLAAVSFPDRDCSIHIFDLTKAGDVAAPAYTLTLPADMFVGYAGACDIGQLAWSPDANWLAFVDGFHSRVYAISVSALVQSSAVATCLKPCAIELSATQLVDMGATSLLNTAPSWSRAAGEDRLTYTVGQSIVRVDPLTLQTETLLKAPGSDVTALAWMPDGQRLLFVQTQNRGDVEPLPLYPASRLYVFTP